MDQHPEALKNETQMPAEENLEGAVQAPEEILPDPMEVLNAENAKLKEALQLAMHKAEEFKDLYLRAKAESENTKRRAQEDIQKAHKFALEKFAGDLLTVKDSLDAALKTQSQSWENLKEGVVLIEKQLDGAFEKNALRTIYPLGEKFNPHQHQAIGYQESDYPKDSVAQVLQKGYFISDRVLRPALVMVSSGKKEETPVEQEGS